MMLEVEDLVKHYRGDGDETIRAIDGVSFNIDAGELVALYGPSGSGKSTLLQVIAALMRPDRGRVVVDGTVVTELSSARADEYRRTTLGFIGQDADLLPGLTALDNAALKLVGGKVRWKEARTRVTPLLVDLELHDRLGQRVEHLSKGEQQRVTIARALSSEPRLILADEPTGALDTERSEVVLSLLTDLCKANSVAMLLVTHDPLAAKFASRVQTLRDGQLHDAPVALGTR